MLAISNECIYNLGYIERCDCEDLVCTDLRRSLRWGRVYRTTADLGTEKCTRGGVLEEGEEWEVD